MTVSKVYYKHCNVTFRVHEANKKLRENYVSPDPRVEHAPAHGREGRRPQPDKPHARGDEAGIPSDAPGRHRTPTENERRVSKERHGAAAP